MPYTRSVFTYSRRKTVEVGFGIIKLGGMNPIRVESMTTTDTMDTAATVEQCRRLYEAGCEIIRITAPSMKEAENLKHISATLRKMGIQTPLVADIHFTPNAAMKAAEFVENVRINPGNYADRKKFAVREYTDAEYNDELARIHDDFKPLVLKCKEYGRSMRIGTNHGSLSDRIMNRYGDTPLGMVESALEFARICEQYGYYDFIFSMKSSNPQVMIQAYRLLVEKADKELKYAYPLHLGVTEAGDGEEGRVKSAIGIGSLLEDGLGDTIRVSLTEDPVREVEIGYQLVRKYNNRTKLRGENIFQPINQLIRPTSDGVEEPPYNPFEFKRRATTKISVGGLDIGGDAVPRVELSVREPLDNVQSVVNEIVYSAKPFLAEGVKSEFTNLSIESAEAFEKIRKTLDEKFVSPVLSVSTNDTAVAKALMNRVEKIRLDIVEGEPLEKHSLKDLVGTTAIEFSFVKENASDVAIAEILTRIAEKCHAVGLQNAMFSIQAPEMIFSYRRLCAAFEKANVRYPIVLRYDATSIAPSDMKIPNSTMDVAALVEASIQLGSLLCDGIGDAVALTSALTRGDELNLVYNILQATRYRMTKTEFISCPSCGRTLFDLETTTAKIKARTAHLKGLKIGIMGCIVNGPGEMADADFGYVGTGVGEISLYVGKEVVERHIPETEAVDRLVELIKRHNKWKEPNDVAQETASV
ncbi:MAG: 4-hydroxy-3-methylbut-2-en-1-yl diphosphate synthase [[Candidatus Thermochlorobacteriaceae] bacterium GBChlB]|nr:MAG: 4-hydroxy-3-methylbut-2-en-1-yl diphosphate synthase [[Candidatus Thermochlorobacteriaceae] bacterium GBChlB]